MNRTKRHRWHSTAINARRAYGSSAFAATLLAAASFAAPASAQSTAGAPEEASRGAFARWWDDITRDLFVGVQTNVSQEPIVGDDVNVIAFPRPGRLRDYVFDNDDRLAFRESVAMLRLLRPSPWEFSIVGRFDSRGYDPDDEAALAGLDEREWTVGAGLGGAWRGEKVYLEAWGVTDLLGRSEGQTWSAVLGFPRHFRDARLEVIPHVDVFYDSEETTAYYYGVEADEAAPGRPAYAPDGATTVRFATRANYRLQGCWGLSGRFTVDVFGSEITASPIVDRDAGWSVNFAFMRRLRCERDDEADE